MRTKSQLIKPCSESGLLSPFYIDNRNPINMGCDTQTMACTLFAGALHGLTFTLVSHVFLNAQFNQALLFSGSRYTGEMIALISLLPLVSKCGAVCDADNFKSDGSSRSEFLSFAVYYSLVIGGYIIIQSINADLEEMPHGPVSFDEVVAVSCSNLISNFIYKFSLVFGVSTCAKEGDDIIIDGGTHYGSVI